MFFYLKSDEQWRRIKKKQVVMNDKITLILIKSRYLNFRQFSLQLIVGQFGSRLRVLKTN